LLPELKQSARSTVRRRAGRGHYDRQTVDAILDEGLVAHVAIVADGQPYALPMLYARSGEQIVLHGSPLSRLLGTLAGAVPMCITVTLLDGLVLARSAFHHSLNYRSVVVLGEGTPVREPDAKRAALRAIVEHVSPGRSDDVRAPSAQELAATEVIAVPISEASAKVRTGPPVDAEEDYGLEVWAGVLPLALAAGAPVPDARCAAPLPPYVRGWGRGIA
jgi:nitroimidazol reductase NimA-like FMN-containing flavoprotein (pyridoxamine 5'-phosphate oxidase superfamily)